MSYSFPNDTSIMWHTVNISACTLIGCLNEVGVDRSGDLDTQFFDENLKTWKARNTYGDPWLYRREFNVEPEPGAHYFLETNGITPRADIFVNGETVVDALTQAGSYAGQLFDITSLVREKNALVIPTFPTNYDRDFAVGFMDWNPSPPDNGTGVWRDVALRRTGPVLLGPLPLGVESHFITDDLDLVNVTFQVLVTNLENQTQTAVETRCTLESCTDQALAAFAHHDSWGEDGGNFPWDRLDRLWKHAAMQKIVYQVRDGFSLAEQQQPMAAPVPAAAGGGRARASMEDEEEDGDDEDPAMGSQDDDDANDPDYHHPDDKATGEARNPFQGVEPKTKPPLLLKKKQPQGRTPLPPSRSSFRADSPWDVPSSDPNSPTETAALRRVRNSDVAPAASSSSSPVTSVPSSSSSSSARKGAAAGTTSSQRPRTRAVTRASSLAISEGNAAGPAMSSSSSPASSLKRVRGRGSVALDDGKEKQKKRRRTAEEKADGVWPFEKILNVRPAKNGVDGDVEYRVQWVSGKPTWQPSLDLVDNLEELADFHKAFPRKVGPPEWWAEAVARAEGWIEEEESEDEDEEEEEEEQVSEEVVVDVAEKK